MCCALMKTNKAVLIKITYVFEAPSDSSCQMIDDKSQCAGFSQVL